MDSFWSTLYRSALANESIVGRIHLTEQLEELSPYSNTRGASFFHRIRASLQHLPQEYREAALLLFSSVLYYPTAILDDAWRFLWFEMLRIAEATQPDAAFVQRVQFFEIDPSGLANRFAHLNSIEGRLDIDANARIGDIGGLIAHLRHLSNSDAQLQQHAIDELGILRAKRYWAILTDKALSGQSLANDLEKYIQVCEFFNKECGSEIGIVVLAQIMTSDARQHVSEICKLKERPFVRVLSASELDSSCKVNSPECRLFGPAMREKVERLCGWFATTYLLTDSRLDRMREKSGDDLAYGYRQSALTLCDSGNCPTNSLPLLWYESERGRHPAAVPFYRGPYPRTHSRIGDQARKALGSSLRDVGGWKEALLDRI